ncbi:MAG: YdbL family protein [Pseudomonadota bacterium]
MKKLLALAILAAVPATAQTPAVDAARAAGGVGERFDGYIGVNGAVSSAVRSQVATINIQRRSLYSNLAARKGASPLDVGVTAGCHLLARIAVGEAYMLGDGVWRRRAAGQPAPTPNYCR